MGVIIYSQISVTWSASNHPIFRKMLNNVELNEHFFHNQNICSQYVIYHCVQDTLINNKKTCSQSGNLLSVEKYAYMFDRVS